MDNVNINRIGHGLLMRRLGQGLRPRIKVEVRKWKRWHVIDFFVWCTDNHEWLLISEGTEPIPGDFARDWDKTALRQWQWLTGTTHIAHRQAYLSQLLTSMMFSYEMHVSEVSRKGHLRQE